MDIKASPNSPEEFFEDTLMYYMEDNDRRNRSGVSGCKYSPITTGNKKSEGCAIGRYLDPKNALLIDKAEPDNIGIKNLLEKYPQYIPEWMKSFAQDFLTEIQELHDESFNWSIEDGLTWMGLQEVKKIIRKFNLNLSDKFKEYVFSRTGQSL